MKEKKANTFEKNRKCMKHTNQCNSTYSDTINPRQKQDIIRNVENSSINFLEYKNTNNVTEEEIDKKFSMEINSNKRKRFMKELTEQTDTNLLVKKESCDVREHLSDVEENSERMFSTESPEIDGKNIAVKIKENQFDALTTMEAIGMEVNNHSKVENFKICENGENTIKRIDINQKDGKKL
jgi:hypothetical protein